MIVIGNLSSTVILIIVLIILLVAATLALKRKNEPLLSYIGIVVGLVAIVVALMNAGGVFSNENSSVSHEKRIYTADDLKDISNNLSGSYILMKDINLDHTAWEPIGSSSEPFVGKFDGNGHVINNLRIQDPGEYQGLFGMTDGAVITRVKVTGILNGQTYAGGISGYSKNSEITYCINETKIIGIDQIGGIVGRIEGGSVHYCMNTGSITASSRGCGGIAADIYPSGTITNCLNLGNVWGGTDLTGGISGGSTKGYIKSCVNAAKVSCKSGRVGGISGDNESYAGRRENNYFIQNSTIPNNYSVEGSNCGVFSSSDDPLVEDLKKIILQGNRTGEISLEDLPMAALTDIVSSLPLISRKTFE